MPSWIACSNNHSTKSASIQDAAIALSEGRPIGACKKWQFPLLLSLDEWKTLFRKLDASFDELEHRIRLRAYELYEKRGKDDGHALNDWLKAEAELTQRKSLRAAA